MFIHVPAIMNGDTYTVDEEGNPADLEKWRMPSAIAVRGI